jgi:hypothetical protein
MSIKDEARGRAVQRQLHGAVTIRAYPGCVSEGPERTYHGDAFRRYVLELREQHPDVELEHFAEAVMIPLGTLKEWLVAGVGSGRREGAPDGDDNADAPGTVQPSAEIEVVLAAWKGWEGTFRDFCKYLREEQRVSFGPALISNILSVYGKRRPRRRPGRSPDEDALRNAFATFFGGAQWTGDGSPIVVTLNGERFVFNLELMVDTYSGGFVGMSIREEEDSAAVTEALADGITTTEEEPLALLLDNRPSNHTDEVRAALGDVTIPIRATTQRPQNKAHVEGGVGLFRQAVPPDTGDLVEPLARLPVEVGEVVEGAAREEVVRWALGACLARARWFPSAPFRTRRASFAMHRALHQGFSRSMGASATRA